jgi:hypothetical protein
MKKLKLMILSAVLILIVLLLSLSTTVFAGGSGLNIQGNILTKTISPGQSYIHTITVSNDSPLDLEVEASGLGQTVEGATVALSPDQDTSSHSARTFISNIDKTSLHLEPGVPQDIKVTLSVPQGTPPGERYAIVYIHSKAAANNVGVIIGSNIPIILTIPGSIASPQGQVTDLSVPTNVAGKQIQINTTFKNTGDIRIQAKNTVTVTDSSGSVLSQSTGSLTPPSIIPTFSRLFATIPKFSGSTLGLPVGQYFVESKIMLDNGTVLDAKKISFTIGENAQSKSESTSQAPIGPIGLINKMTQSPISPVNPATPGVNWALAGGIIAGILIIGIVAIYLLTRRPARRNS